MKFTSGNLQSAKLTYTAEKAMVDPHIVSRYARLVLMGALLSSVNKFYGYSLSVCLFIFSRIILNLRPSLLVVVYLNLGIMRAAKN